MATQAINNSLISRLNQLGISDQSKDLLFRLQNRYFNSLPEMRTEMEDYLIYRHPAPQEIAAGYLAMREYLAGRHYLRGEIDRRSEVFLNFYRKNQFKINQPFMDELYKREINDSTEKYYQISGLH